MSSTFFTALGPGNKLGSLNSFAPDYLAARNALNELLVFPNLDAIAVGDVPDSTVGLFGLVSSGNSRLSDLTNINVDLARKVISYDETISALLSSLPVQILVQTLQPVAKGYADQARAQSETSQRFFSAFSDYVDTINDRIAALEAKLEELDSQIELQSDALARRNIIATLWEVLKTLYKLASTAEDSDVQIASILGVTVSTIFGSFKGLFEDGKRLQQILNGLQALRDQIGSLKTRFVVLSKSLTIVITNSRDLLSIWDDIAARQDAVGNVTDIVPGVIAQQITNAWAQVAADARQYAQALTQPTTSAQLTHAIRSAQINANVKVPITAHEIRFHKLAAAVANRTPVSSAHAALGAAVADNNDDGAIEKVLGPPGDTQQKLQALADSTGKIIDGFNKLLETPYLDQILCTSPIDGSDSNLYIVMNYYRERYLKLQQDTLPVVQALATYAVLQQTLLPFVKRDDQANEAAGDIKMSTFLNTNTSMVAGYLESSAALSKRSTEVKNGWENAINLVKIKIDECDKNIKSWGDSIDQLTEEQKKLTMYASLAAFGAFIAFTATVFLPGIGMLAVLAAGAVLGATAVYLAIQAGKISEAINDLKGAIAIAHDARAKFEALVPHMLEISQNISSVSHIWSDIATALTTLNTFYGVLNGPTGPIILDTLKPRIINLWGVVNTDVKNYIAKVLG